MRALKPYYPNVNPPLSLQNKGGPPPHPYVPRSASGRPLGKPPTSRGHVKHLKGKGKKGKKGKKDQYDLIVNIDLVSYWAKCLKGAIVSLCMNAC